MHEHSHQRITCIDRIWSHFCIIIFFYHFLSLSHPVPGRVIIFSCRAMKKNITASHPPLLSHFGTSRRVHFPAHPPSISIFIPLRNNPPHYPAALRSQLSLSAFIIIKVESRIRHGTKTPLESQSKSRRDLGKIRIRIRPIRIPFAFLPQAHSAAIGCLATFQIDRRSSLT